MWMSAELYQLDMPQVISTARVTRKRRVGWRIWLHDRFGSPLGVGEVAPWEGFGSGVLAVENELASWSRYPDQRLPIPQSIEQILTGAASTWHEALDHAYHLTTRFELLKDLTSEIVHLACCPEVRAGIELAVLDALARHKNVPLCMLLEPRAPLSAPTHRIVTTLDDAITAARQGFTALKVKVGKRGDEEQERRFLLALQKTLPHIQLRLDANQAWSAEDADSWCEFICSMSIDWLEEPTQKFNILSELMTRPYDRVRLGVDESISQTQLSSSSFLQQCAELGVGVLTLKPMVLGGLIPTIRWALDARDVGLDVCVTHTMGSVIERRGAASLLAALRPELREVSGGLGGGLLKDLAPEWPIQGGELYLSADSGLGIALSREVQQATKDPETISQAQHHADRSFDSSFKLRAQSSLPHPLLSAASARPDHTAWRGKDEQEESVSYSTLAQRVVRIADQLSMTLMVEHRSEINSHQEQELTRIVALVGSLDSTWLTYCYALSGMGVSIAPLNPALTQHELDDALTRVGADALIQLSSDDVKLFIYSTQETSVHELPSRQQMREWSRETSEGRLQTSLTRLGSWGWEESRFIICTSGTTGQPQAIQLNTRQLCLSAFGSAVRLGHHLDDVWLACLPPYHVGGLSLLLRCLFYQITVQAGRPDPLQIAQALVEGRCTLASLTPTMLAAVIQQLQTMDEGNTLSAHHRVRRVLIGGGATSTELWTEAQKVGLPIVLTWGMSETASQVCTQLYPAPPHRPLPLLPFVGVTLDAEERFNILGPLTQNGMLKTGDQGVIQEQGVIISGRADDAIVSGGINLSPNEIETVLRTHPSVKDAAVVGVPDKRYGARPVAFFVSEPEHRRALIEGDLRTWCRNQLSTYKCPELFLWIDRIPRGTLGKLKRSALKEEAREHYHLFQIRRELDSKQEGYKQPFDEASSSLHRGGGQ